ncbi:MAG TPA: DMT family transporter [Methanoregula sp.]|nr:DMT family transporter [Methanoregula sp.]
MQFFSRGRSGPFATIAAAAVLFGIAVPVLKVLVSSIAPVMLVAVLSLGAAAGSLSWLLVRKQRVPVPMPRLERAGLRLLAGTVVVGGFLAPVIQVTSLTVTPAAAASVLLNVEIVSTVLIAFLLFREPVDRWTAVALAAILAGSVLLSWNGGPDPGFSAGAAGIILACVLWAWTTTSWDASAASRPNRSCWSRHSAAAAPHSPLPFFSTNRFPPPFR